MLLRVRLSVACVSGPSCYYFSAERLASGAACDGDDVAAPNRAFSAAFSAPEAQRRTDSAAAAADYLGYSVESCLMSVDRRRHLF